MKLRRFLAAVLAFVLIISNSPLEFITFAAEEPQKIAAINESKVLRSAAVKYTEGAAFLERGNTNGIYGDDPRIDTLLTQAPGEFNKSGEEWVWIAYKVTVPTGGTYTLGVETNSCKWANFKLPMVVNGKVYTLTYTQKAQQQTAEVALPAGDHVVTVFWPMPANESEVYVDADWNSYLWCNIASLVVDSLLTVSLPTAQEVEQSVAVKEDTVVSAIDTSLVLRSAAVKHTDGYNYLERGDTNGIYGDDPRIDTLLADAAEEFNKSGEEWPWIAYKVSVPEEGTYALSVNTNSCKSANFKLPMVVNGKVYTLTYTAMAQKQTAEVELSAGEHVVTVFWPMPANESEVYVDADWNSYLWCNIASLVVDSELSVFKPTVQEVEACFQPLDHTVVSAVDADALLWSAAMGDKGYGYLEFNSRDAVKADKPYIDTLHLDAAGQFNASGSEWGWVAANVTAQKAGTYTLGVQVQNCRNAPYKIPLFVNGKTYILSCAATGKQSASVEVELSAGTHTVVMFMPMPQNASEDDGAGKEYIDYPWCNMQSLTVDYKLTASKPTAQEVEACFPIGEDAVLPAVDSDKLLWSAAMGDKGYGYLEFNSRDAVKADKPYIDTLHLDAAGQFNASGSEWGWVAANVTAQKAGTYTLGVQVQNCRNAPYKIPLFVNGKTYILSCAATGKQSASVEVELSAGTHTVVMFMPMPQNASEDDGAGKEYIDYPWCNMQSLTVDWKLTTAKPAVEEVEACFQPLPDTVISAVDTNNILLSETIEQNAASLGRTDRETLNEDRPSIESIYADAAGEFNAPGSEWNWLAYKITVRKAGTYTLGVKTSGSKFESYKIPLCVNNEVYALSYTAKGQLATTEVTLSPGEYVVTVFMPMPENKAAIQGNAWNDYHWCDVESVTVDYMLAVSKPTVSEVEACFAPKTLSAIDTSYMLWSDAVKHTEGDSFLKRDDASGIIADLPYIDSLYRDAVGQFNAAEGAWPWFAYQVTVPAAGTYTLGVRTADCKNEAYAIPLCVNGKVYTLNYTAKSQQVTAEVELPAGEHTVVMFMPMPQNTASTTSNAWNDYIWCNVESMIVAAGLEVSKPTVEAVEACFPDTAKDSPLWQQSVLFVGDSITHSGSSWASKIGTWNAMDWTNAGVSGATISELRDKIIRHQLMANAGKDFGYVIMHGGMNDAAVPVGTVSDSWNVADFDTTTYAGALETMFYYAYENFGTAKLGYIINYATPNADTTKWAGTNDMSACFEMGKKICEKWGIAYIDLYSGTTEDGKSYSYDILQVDTVKQHFVGNDPTEIHLSDAGYRAITPYIESWMETLTVKDSPIPEANRGKYVEAGNADKVLSGGFTAQGGILADRVYDGMAEDEANLEYLPHAKDLLADWAFGAIQVNAAEAGEYTVKVEVSAKNAALIGALVDGEAHTLSYSKSSGHYEYLELTVQLEAGTHYILFTAAMPENDNSLTGTAWNDYPWTNIASVVVGSGLEVMAAPSLENITGELDNNVPFYNRVEAEDGDYVIYNNYNTPNESNNKASGAMMVGGAWHSTYQQTFEELQAWLDVKHNAYVEYAVIAPADGEYDIRVGFLAGSNDKSVAKPYIAVVVNGTAHKAQFTKDWNQVDKVKLTVSLKAGLNIIRCTSITTEQEVYGVKGWINHDFLDIDKELTAVKHSSVTVEAEDSKFVNKFQVQDGADYENASGKVLGGADRKYVTGLKLTLDQLTEAQLKQVPYFSITVTAPENGYYPISVNMAADGRLPRGTIGMLVDGKMNVVPYARTGKSVTGGAVDALVYLTKGDHVITFTIPMPVTADAEANYAYYWCNFDCVTLYNGLTLADTQKAPTMAPDQVRVEVEDHAMFNQNSSTGTAVGNAYYRSSQTIAEMLANGINGKKTPFAQMIVHAENAGEYTFYLGVSAGMTQGCTQNEIVAEFVVDVNGKLQTASVRATKSSVHTVVPVTLKLEKGINVIRLTHFSKDAQCGGTTWIDFDYIEMSEAVREQLEFVKTGGKLEAEDNAYSGYSEFANSSYSNGQYLGDPDYNEVDEGDITFEKLDPSDVGELPHVTYRVFAEKAGTYALTVGFAAGMHKYTSAEIAEGTTSGFAVIVNGETKQLVEYAIASTNSKMTRLVMVELQEGENEVTFTTTLAEYIIDHVPYNEETARKVWVDHDYLVLSDGLSAMSAGGNDYDVGDSDIDHTQIETKPSAGGDEDSTEPTVRDPAGGVDVLVIIWVLAAVAVACVLLIIILCKKRKNKK